MKFYAFTITALALATASPAQAKCAPDYTVGLRPMVLAFGKSKSGKWIQTDSCYKNLWKYVTTASKSVQKTEVYLTALTTLHNAIQEHEGHYDTSKCSIELMMNLEENDDNGALLETALADLNRCLVKPGKEPKLEPFDTDEI